MQNCFVSKIYDSSIEDFPVECDINQCTSFPILDKRCPCGQLLGYYQRAIESKIGIGLKTESLSQSRIKMISEFGITKDCCIRSLTMYQFCFFNDICGADSFVDVTYSYDENGNSVRKKYRNRYDNTPILKPQTGEKKATTTKGTKDFAGFYPVSYFDQMDFEKYEKKLFDFSRREKDLIPNDGDYPSKLLFPRKIVNTNIELIEPSVPIPFS